MLSISNKFMFNAITFEIKILFYFSLNTNKKRLIICYVLCMYFLSIKPIRLSKEVPIEYIKFDIM